MKPEGDYCQDLFGVSVLICKLPTVSKGKRYAIIVAGGSGSRMESEIPKQFLELDGTPILIHTLRKYRDSSTDEVILVIPEGHKKICEELLSDSGFHDVQLVIGGKERFDSVRNGLLTIEEESGVVAVHDAVRPMVTPELIDRSYEQAEQFGSAVVAVPLKDSIREKTYELTEARDRSKYMLIQTPQTFDLASLILAYNKDYQTWFTDDASVFEDAGQPIHLLEGDYKNIKITTPEDLQVASVFIKE